MIGIGIVTYNDIIDRSDEATDLFEMTIDEIESISMFTNDDFILIIRDNDSIDYRYKKFNITLNKRFSHINTIFIPSKVNKLTDAWNEILDISFNKYNCDASVILNNDLIVTKYWQNYLNAIKVQSRDLIGPITSDAPFQPLQTVIEEAFFPEDALLVVPDIQGHCLGGSRRAFEENKYDNNCYFDPELEFAFNEEEWILRNNISGGRCLLAMNSYVIHLNAARWNINSLWNEKNLPDKPISFAEKTQILDVIDYDEYLTGKYSI